MMMPLANTKHAAGDLELASSRDYVLGAAHAMCACKRSAGLHLRAAECLCGYSPDA